MKFECLLGALPFILKAAYAQMNESYCTISHTTHPLSLQPNPWFGYEFALILWELQECESEWRWDLKCVYIESSSSMYPDLIHKSKLLDMSVYIFKCLQVHQNIKHDDNGLFMMCGRGGR